MKHTFKLALVGALCSFPAIAQACSCMAPPAPKIALEKSAAVFVGRVASVEKSQFSNKFQFSVSKQWKGIEGKTASIVTATNSAACGIVFDEDRDYLIYAYKTEGDDQLRTNLCTRTARVADAATDLAELGAPLTATQTQMATPTQTQTMSYPTDDNGIVQIGAGEADPLVALAKALEMNQKATQFRVNWTAPAGDSFIGTSLYNRADSTLKSYSRAETKEAIRINAALYSGVSDEVLQKLAATDERDAFFRNYADYGVTKKDVGTKTVRLRSPRMRAPR